METRQSTADKVKGLLESKTKIFDTRSLSSLWGIGRSSAKVQAFRLVRAGILFPIRRGLYSVVTKEPSSFELANALYQPSVISVESALNHWGVLATVPQTVTSVANRSKRCLVGNQEFIYRQVPKRALEIGAVQEQCCFIMEPRKALLDFLYFVVKGFSTVEPGDFFMTKNTDWMSTQRYLIFYPPTVRGRMKALLDLILKRRYRGVR